MKIFTEVLEGTLTLLAGTEDSDKPLNNLLSRVEHKIFGITGSTEPDIKIDLGSAKSCNYMMSSNCSMDNGTIQVYCGDAVDDGATWDKTLLPDPAAMIIINDSVNYHYFDASVTKRYYQIQVSFDSETSFRMGNIFLGTEYETPRESRIPIKIGQEFNVFSNTIGNVEYTSITGLSTDNKTNADNYFERGLKFNRFTEAHLETFRAELENLNGTQKPFYLLCEDGTYRYVYIENMILGYGKQNKDDYGFTLNMKELT